MLDPEPAVTRQHEKINMLIHFRVQESRSATGEWFVVGLRAGRAITMNSKNSSLRGLRFDVFFSCLVTIIIGGT